MGSKKAKGKAKSKKAAGIVNMVRKILAPKMATEPEEQAAAAPKKTVVKKVKGATPTRASPRLANLPPEFEYLMDSSETVPTVSFFPEIVEPKPVKEEKPKKTKPEPKSKKTLKSEPKSPNKKVKAPKLDKVAPEAKAPTLTKVSPLPTSPKLKKQNVIILPKRPKKIKTKPKKDSSKSKRKADAKTDPVVLEEPPMPQLKPISELRSRESISSRGTTERTVSPDILMVNSGNKPAPADRKATSTKSSGKRKLPVPTRKKFYKKRRHDEVRLQPSKDPLMLEEVRQMNQILAVVQLASAQVMPLLLIKCEEHRKAHECLQEVVIMKRRSIVGSLCGREREDVNSSVSVFLTQQDVLRPAPTENKSVDLVKRGKPRELFQMNVEMQPPEPPRAKKLQFAVKKEVIDEPSAHIEDPAAGAVDMGVVDNGISTEPAEPENFNDDVDEAPYIMDVDDANLVDEGEQGMTVSDDDDSMDAMPRLVLVEEIEEPERRPEPTLAEAEPKPEQTIVLSKVKVEKPEPTIRVPVEDLGLMEPTNETLGQVDLGIPLLNSTVEAVVVTNLKLEHTNRNIVAANLEIEDHKPIVPVEKSDLKLKPEATSEKLVVADLEIKTEPVENSATDALEQKQPKKEKSLKTEKPVSWWGAMSDDDDTSDEDDKKVVKTTAEAEAAKEPSNEVSPLTKPVFTLSSSEDDDVDDSDDSSDDDTPPSHSQDFGASGIPVQITGGTDTTVAVFGDRRPPGMPGAVHDSQGHIGHSGFNMAQGPPPMPMPMPRNNNNTNFSPPFGPPNYQYPPGPIYPIYNYFGGGGGWW